MKSYSNSVYQNAALGEANGAAAFFLFEETGFFLGAAAGLFVFLAKPSWARRLTIVGGDLSGLSADALRKRWRRRILQAGLCLTLMAISLLFFSVSEFTRLQLNASFQQRLTVLAPYITDHQEKQLESTWASMKDRGDYDKVNRKLEGYGDEFHVKIPGLLPGAE